MLDKTIMFKQFFSSLRFENRREERSGVNVIKLFTAVIYGFLYKARVFVMLDWKCIPMTNAVAYYKNCNLRTKKFITMHPGVNVIKLFTTVFYKC